MAKLTVVYWRDIPAQIIAKQGRQSAKVQLSERFQVAIDRAAMRAGKGSSDAYLADWRRDIRQCGNDLESEARSVADELEQQFDDARLEIFTKNKGLDPGAQN